MQGNIGKLLEADVLVAIGLVASLLVSIFFADENLASTIASGLIGYIGRGQISKVATPPKEGKL